MKLQTSMWSYLIFLLILSLAESQSRAQEAQPKIPKSIVLPWTEIAISREVVELARQSTDAARKSLAKMAIPNAQTLSKVAPPTLLPTLAKFGDQVYAGEMSTQEDSVTFAPIWCSVGDSYVFNLLALDTLKANILAHASYRVKKDAWERKSGPKKLNPIPSSAIKALYEDVQATLTKNARSKNLTDALHVGLALARETTRNDVGSSMCVNVMVAGKLSKDYTIVSPVAGEYMASIRNAFKLPATIRRPTRSILTRWDFPSSKGRPISFPLQLKLNSQYSETVFGQILGNAQESTWTFIAEDEGMVSVGLDSALVEFLNGEKRALNLAESPQSSKIYGAWVYLDRGRAYGLHMDDRLVGKSADGKEITGHIVGFFGPEKNIKSPRGYVINEGAIMFVRKGQHITKIGQDYTFDPKMYPLAGNK